MRIIVANYRFFIAGGPERYMFNFMEAAEERGIEVIPFSVKNANNQKTKYSEYFAEPRANELYYKDSKKNIRNYIGYFKAVVWNWDAERKLRRLIRDTKPDAIYILHEINHLSPSIIRAAKKENLRVVHRISDFFMFCPRYDFLCNGEVCQSCLSGRYSNAFTNRCVKGSFWATLLRVFAMKIYSYNKVFEDVDQYVCTCNFSKNILIKGGIKEDKISVVPTFIDSEKIQPKYTNKKYFLILGRIAKQKGTLIAIKAFKRVHAYGYKLVITGEINQSEDQQEILKYIDDNKLKDSIIFTGFVRGKKLSDIISNSTCVLCPSIWYENLPNSVIESFAYGKPVIASRLGSLAEIIDDGETGYLFTAKNDEELADRMLCFIKHPEISSEMGKRARRKCMNIYNKDQHMSKIIHLLKGEN